MSDTDGDDGNAAALLAPVVDPALAVATPRDEEPRTEKAGPQTPPVNPKVHFDASGKRARIACMRFNPNPQSKL
jgi:hypothetical protein